LYIDVLGSEQSTYLTMYHFKNSKIQDGWTKYTICAGVTTSIVVLSNVVFTHALAEN